MYMKFRNTFHNKTRTMYQWSYVFFAFSAPPSPEQKKTLVKSKALVNKELKWRQAHWFVEICQSLSGWLHICLRNNSYLYSAQAAGQALAIRRRSASARGLLVGIPTDSPASLWGAGGGTKPCLLCWWGTELWSFSSSLGLAWGLGSQSRSQWALSSHTHAHTRTHPFAGRFVSRL